MLHWDEFCTEKVRVDFFSSRDHCYGSLDEGKMGAAGQMQYTDLNVLPVCSEFLLKNVWRGVGPCSNPPGASSLQGFVRGSCFPMHNFLSVVHVCPSPSCELTSLWYHIVGFPLTIHSLSTFGFVGGRWRSVSFTLCSSNCGLFTFEACSRRKIKKTVTQFIIGQELEL